MFSACQVSSQYSFICQYAPVIISSFSLQTLRSNSISIVDRESRVYISTGMSSLSLNLTLYGKIIVSNGYCTWEKNRVYLRRRRQPVSSHHSPHSTHCSTIGAEERYHSQKDCDAAQSFLSIRFPNLLVAADPLGLMSLKRQ